MDENKELENEGKENEGKGAGAEGDANKSPNDSASGDKGNKGNGSSKGDSKGGENDKLFTQDQVNRMMTTEKNQGRAAALKELGIDAKDAKAVAMVKALMESQKTDEQKTAEKESQKAAEVEAANLRALTAEAKAEAMQLGVKAQYVDDIVTLAMAKMTENSELKTIIGEFKTKYPVWFEQPEDDTKAKAKGKTGQKGTGSSINNQEKGKKDEDNKGLGARLAAQRKPSGKSSYWGK